MGGDKIYPSKTKNISGVILAGGFSSRMNKFKPLMPLGNSTVIELTIKTLKDTGIKDVIVVTGYRAEELKKALNQFDVRFVYNENYNQGMYSSIVVGVKSLRPGSDGFLLLPSDMPLVKGNTINKLLGIFGEDKYDIVYPVFEGHRGHPPIISRRLYSDILNWDGAKGGLQAMLALHQSRSFNLSVDDMGILTDIDTQEEYIEVVDILNKMGTVTDFKQ